MLPAAAATLLLGIVAGCGTRETAAPPAPSPPSSPSSATVPPSTPAASPSPSPSPSAATASTAAPGVDDLLDDDADAGDLPMGPAPSIDGVAPAGLDLPSPPAPGRCVLLGAPVRVWPVSTPPALASSGEVALVAGYVAEGGRDVAFLVESSPGRSASPLRRIALDGAAPADRRTAPPGILALPDGRVLLALAHADGRLVLRAVRRGDPVGAAEPTVPMGEGADLRFSPALARVGDRIAVAWTDGRSTPMHLRVLVLDAALRPLGPARDVTPTSMGAAAPAFVSGTPAAQPILLFLDPRRGISPIHRLELDRDGPRGESRVIVSTGVAPDRPVLAAALAGGIHPRVAWAVVGNAATTAVGLARLDPAWTPYARAPEPLVPGTAYTPLSVSAARLQSVAVFAADHPQAGGTSPPVRIDVRVVGSSGALGDALVVTGPDGTARGPALVSSARDRLLLAFRDGGGTYAARVACAP